MRRAVGLAVGGLTLAVVGCTGEDNDPSASAVFIPGTTATATTATTPSTPTAGPAGSSPGAWSLDGVRVDRVPADPPRVASALPASFPADDAQLPDMLAEPPGRARLAYHPRETFDDRNGWADERVFFLGMDGGWRALDMVDLGLSETTHPGVDTYGAGYLSPDGTRWAAPSNVGIVLLDLHTARWNVVPLPGAQTSYLGWRPDGLVLDVVRFSGASTYRTWSVEPRSLRTSRAAYRLPIDGYAHDGSVVTFSSRDGDTVRTVHRDGTPVTDVVPLAYEHARLGGEVGPTHTLFGLNRGLLVVDNTSTAPVARLRLGPPDAAGWPRGWWDEDTVWFYEGTRGLVTWDVATGELGTLTRVRPGTRRDSYWTASVAVGLMR